MTPAEAGRVDAARAWLGTPYCHRASLRGQGADCLGLIRGIWRDTVGDEPESIPAYAPDWAEVGGRETLRDAAGRWLVERADGQMRPGDVLLFRMAAGAPAKHCAILSADTHSEPRMIHAYWGRAVVESWMGAWWQRRLVAVFTWPDQD
jgi:NlpC/P60 family putative phage cell wall peptidase